MNTSARQHIAGGPLFHLGGIMAKKRGAGEGSIFQRGDGRWSATITVGHSSAGKRLRKTVYGPTKRDVTEQLTRLQNQKLDGQLIAREKLTVADLCNRWLDHWTQNLTETSRKRYRDIVERFIKPRIGNVGLSKLRPAHVRGLLDQLAAEGLGDRQRQYVFATIRRALNLAVRLELAARNVCEAVDSPKVTRRDIRPLTPHEADALLRHVAGTRWEAYFTLALSTGLRQGELFALVWDDIDLERGVLSVRHSVEEIDGRLIVKEPKSASGRRAVRLDPTDVHLLREHRRILADEGHGFGQLVFCDSQGGILRRSNVQRNVWNPIRVALGLQGVRFHDLRHSSASVMLRAGIHPKIVQERLGHSTIKLTMDTYSHLLPDAQNEAAGAFHRSRRSELSADGCNVAVTPEIAGKIDASDVA